METAGGQNVSASNSGWAGMVAAFNETVNVNWFSKNKQLQIGIHVCLASVAPDSNDFFFVKYDGLIANSLKTLQHRQNTYRFPFRMRSTVFPWQKRAKARAGLKLSTAGARSTSTGPRWSPTAAPRWGRPGAARVAGVRQVRAEPEARGTEVATHCKAVPLSQRALALWRCGKMALLCFQIPFVLRDMPELEGQCVKVRLPLSRERKSIRAQPCFTAPPGVNDTLLNW